MARKLGDATRAQTPTSPAGSSPKTWTTLLPGDKTPGQQLPLQPGNIYLTNEEKKLCEQLGIGPDTKVPADLAKRLQQVLKTDDTDAAIQALQTDSQRQASLARDPSLPIDPATPPLKPTQLVDMQSLSPAKQAEMRKTIEEFQQYAYLLEQGAKTDAMAPGVAEAIAAGRGTDAPPPASVPDPDIPRSRTPTRTASPAAAAVPITETLAEHVKFCSFCGWDQAKLAPGYIDPDDKLRFIAAAVSGDRFRKTYSLLRGNVTIVFRGLTVSETNLARQQLIVDGARDLKESKVKDPVEYSGDVQLYLTCMSLEKISVAGGDGGVDIEPIAEIELPAIETYSYPSPDTKIIPFVRLVMTEILKTESLKRMAMDAYVVFNHTLRQLETKAHDPNF